MTMLVATHEMAFAREIADTVFFLHAGRIVESGPPAQVLERPRSRRAPGSSCCGSSRPAATCRMHRTRRTLPHRSVA